MQPSDSRLRLELQVLLVTTLDAVEKLGRDPVGRELALVRARRILSRLEERVEGSADPEALRLYRHMAALIANGLLGAVMLLAG